MMKDFFKKIPLNELQSQGHLYLLIMPIRLEGGRLRRGIFTLVMSSIPPVMPMASHGKTDGYDFPHA